MKPLNLSRTKWSTLLLTALITCGAALSYAFVLAPSAGPETILTEDAPWNYPIGNETDCAGSATVKYRDSCFGIGGAGSVGPTTLNASATTIFPIPSGKVVYEVNITSPFTTTWVCNPAGWSAASGGSCSPCTPVYVQGNGTGARIHC